jgi:electron transfer flavoprotein alpha subunit
MPNLKIIEVNCKGCGLCVKVCPFGALQMINRKAVVLPNCNDCGACVASCKFNAMQLERRGKTPTPEKDSYKGVWVFVEHTDGQIAHVAFELLGEGKKLAQDLGATLSAFVLGDRIEPLAAELFAHGAATVYMVEHPALAKYRTNPYVEGAACLVRKYRPEIILLGATTMGRDIAGALATTLDTGLTADCTALEIDPQTKLLQQTRPAFGGNIMATIICPHNRPQMATVRPKIFELPVRNAQAAGRLVKERMTWDENIITTKVLEFIKGAEDVNLADTEIIISGGRGMKGAEHFALLHELADLLGGVVGASRAAVDAGWISYAHQVGQTGKTVRPRIYFACGISGSVQHQAGMKTSDVIIAINQDPYAPIFDIATYGIVGDVFAVVPLLIEQLKKRGR